MITIHDIAMEQKTPTSNREIQVTSNSKCVQKQEKNNMVEHELGYIPAVST